MIFTRLKKVIYQRTIAGEVGDPTIMLARETSMEEERSSTTILNSKTKVNTLREESRLMLGT